MHSDQETLGLRAGVYAIFMLLGVGTLLPFNVLITERDFFEVRSKVVPTWEFAADNSENLIVFIFQLCNFVGFLALLPSAARLTLRFLVLGPLIVNMVVMATAFALACTPDTSGRFLLGAVLPAVGVTGASTACLQAGTFALAAYFPPLYMQAVLAGQAMAGLAVAITSFITLWMAPPAQGPSSPQHVSAPAATYFLSATAIMATSAFAYMLLWQIPFVLRCWAAVDPKHGENSQPSDAIEWEQRFGQDQAPRLSSAATASSCLISGASARSPSPHINNCTSSMQRNFIENDHLPSQQPDRQQPTGDLSGTFGGTDSKQWTSWSIAVELKSYIAAVALAFVVTLAVFPGIATSICSSHSLSTVPPCTPHPQAGRLHGELFVPLVFVSFNAGDIMGRLSASIGPWGRSPPAGYTLITYAAARLLLAAAVAVCRVTHPHSWVLPLIFRSDYWPMVFTWLLGVTNGHLVSLVCMHAPALLPKRAKGGCGAVLAFSITTGITIGSVIALLLSVLLQKR